MTREMTVKYSQLTHMRAMCGFVTSAMGAAFTGGLRFCAVLLIAGLCLLPGRGRAEIVLTFGTYAADKPSATARKYLPFLKFLEAKLSQELGEPVKIHVKIAKEYDESINDLAQGRVDLARFGPASYIVASERNPGIEIIAIESFQGQKRFKGVIAVHRDSQIASVAELEGLSFAFGDELSTIGRYLSQAYLMDNGIYAGELHHYEYLGRHDKVGEAVGAGRFSAGALKESTFQELVAKGVPLRALVSFDNVTKPWLARAGLEPRITQAIRRVMLDSDNEEIVKRISKNGFLLGDDTDYDIIRKAMARSANF